jgi:Ca2+-binding EF-hand superfamily protein
MRSLAVVLTGSLLLLGTGALAEDTPAQDDGGRHAWHGRGHGGMWKQLDKDGDGELSDQERADAKAAWGARREARKTEMLANFDKDGDGELSAEEKREAWKSGAGEMRKKMFVELDKDDDGKISTDEIQTKMETMRSMWDGNKAFESKLTEEEKAAMKSISEKRIKEMIEKFDADEDGQITEKEIVSGMAAARELWKMDHTQCEDTKAPPL